MIEGRGHYPIPQWEDSQYVVIGIHRWRELMSLEYESKPLFELHSFIE